LRGGYRGEERDGEKENEAVSFHGAFQDSGLLG
jgi:hypothetical protein